MIDSEDDPILLKAKINGETARIPWCDLQRFFAQGRLLYVNPGIDLVELAAAMSRDDAEQVSAWLQAERISGVSDEQARGWFEADAVLWAVVVRPWVLVQDSE